MEAIGDSALWQAVYDSPDDDAPRHVLADYLQERGDPRGELIALQLFGNTGQVTPDAIGRMTRLVNTWGEAWLGPLRSITKHATIERGFLHTITLTNLSRSNHWDSLLADPSFGTVERIDVRYQNKVFAMVMASPASTNLREVTIHSATFWHSFVAHPPASLERLICTKWTQRSGHSMSSEYEAGFANHVLPYVERSPGITTLGLDLKMLPRLSHQLRARLSGIVCEAKLEHVLQLWDELPTLTSLVTSRPFSNFGISHIELVRTENQELVRIKKHAVSHGVTHKQATKQLLQLPDRFTVIELINNRPLAKWIQSHHAKRFTVVSRPALHGVVHIQG